MVTFLFHTVGEKVLLDLVTAYHQTNQDVFIDPLREHLHQARSHLEACRRSWMQSPRPADLAIVESLKEAPGYWTEAFRICRDLAFCDAPEVPPPFFFLSCSDLGNRVRIDQRIAHRELSSFQSSRVITLFKKGT